MVKETQYASEQRREELKLALDQEQKFVPDSTLVKKFKIQTRPIIYDLSNPTATSNKS